MCARCNAELVRAPEAVGDVHAIIGRECHIIARAPRGPRGGVGPRVEIDAYQNLILLCANWHAVIDSQPERFPPHILRRIRTEHEERVARRSAASLSDIRLRGRDRPCRLQLVRSGDALLDILGPSFSFAYEHPDRLSSSQRELLATFLQACRTGATSTPISGRRAASTQAMTFREPSTRCVRKRLSCMPRCGH